MNVAKGHAYGNDFLLVPYEPGDNDVSGFVRRMCDRHQGIGADGVIFYRERDRGARMDLANADGSYSELSGNGIRVLAAHLARTQGLAPGTTVTIDSDAGPKTLDLLSVDRSRYTFRAAMGEPTDVREVKIPVLNETIRSEEHTSELQSH